MNEEAIQILTSEPCASWLRKRWTPKLGDWIFDHDTQHVFLYNGDLQREATYMDLNISWLPRVEDFISKNGLLKQAGATVFIFDLDERFGFNLECHAGLFTRRIFDADDILLACAKALQWLLENREASDE